MTKEVNDKTKRSTLPLCVDLDGSLIRTDVTVEVLLQAVRQAPWIVFFLPLWFLKGKAYIKHQLAQRADLDVTVLPYNKEVLELIQDAKVNARTVLLVTGSHKKFADQISSFLGVFDRVIATRGSVNMTGHAKAQTLLDEFGNHGFEYVGNDSVDMFVWNHAGFITTVNVDEKLKTKVGLLGKDTEHISTTSPSLKTWLKAIRIHQWAKNGLLFIPLITAHLILDPSAISACVLAFISFGLCASPTYIVNDLLDLTADRQHNSKQNRPFASGVLSIKAGLIATFIMLIAGLYLAWFLPLPFQLTLLVYIGTTLLYSFWLKRIASLDVLVLAGLYTLRVVAGAFAIGLSPSFWLLAFAMFVFLCLAMVKRVAELIELRDRDVLNSVRQDKIIGREYNTGDIQLLQTMGASSGYLSALVLALYINSPEVIALYKTPEFLWLIVPLLLLWLTRLWMVTSRGYMDDDPIYFAIKDPETWITAAATAIIIAAATTVSLT